jgi:hypothetical protein
MQAARRVLASAGILGRRNMTTAAQLAADASKPKGSIVDTIGVWTVTPLAVGVFIYDMFISHEVRAGGCSRGSGTSTGLWATGAQHLYCYCCGSAPLIALPLPLLRPSLLPFRRTQTRILPIIRDVTHVAAVGGV